MFWMCIRIASVRRFEATLIHIHNICFYGDISKFFTFYHFNFDPRFFPFLLYVRWKSGVTFVRRCFRDAKFHQIIDCARSTTRAPGHSRLPSFIRLLTVRDLNLPSIGAFTILLDSEL